MTSYMIAGKTPMMPERSPTSGRAAQRDVAFEMVVAVAEVVIDHDQSLGEVRHGQFPCHPDTPVHLDGFFAHQGLRHDQW